MKAFDAVIYQAGERGQLGGPARAAREFVAMATANPAAELSVVIGGYDQDPRELFDIPEVMAFLRAMVTEMGKLLPGAAIGPVFGRLSFESRAMMLLAAGVIRREQIQVTAHPVAGAGHA